ncbi:MAG TPA: putative glycoside hydrolase [Longimicrobiales bacterium]|nr:putative glycoside hydrolase [Longimicrobiales bacterium]
MGSVPAGPVPGDPVFSGSPSPPAAGPAIGDPAAAGASVEVEEPPLPAVPIPDVETRPRFARPDSVKGIYLNAWASGSSRKMDRMVELARNTEVNSFVIDIKDVTGYVSHASAVSTARDIGALGEIRIGDLPGLLRRLEAEGIYPIARIVIVKDPLLIDARPELAVQDTAGGVWKDSKNLVWLNLYNRGVWDYHVSLAEEVARLGFPEIQWDYVRFPDASASDLARASFPGDSVGPRSEAVRGFLEYANARLDSLGMDVHTTADVFGVTTTFRRDVGIGQVWEQFIDRVDVALPMVYPSHYWEGSHGVDEPNGHPYEIVRSALEDARDRSAAVEGAGDVRPWLQDFTLGAPRYEAPEVRAQIQATYDAGFDGWILWNPSSRYTEGALMPAGGFAKEPIIRVAGEFVPVSQREAALERGRRRAAAAEVTEARPDAEAASDSIPAPAASSLPADTVGTGR